VTQRERKINEVISKTNHHNKDEVERHLERAEEEENKRNGM